MTTELIINRITPEGINSRVKDNWVSTIVEKGNIYGIRNAMQAIGIFDRISELTLYAIEKTVGPEISRQIDTRGFESMHLYLNPQQLNQVHKRLTSVLNPLALTIGKRFGERIFKYKSVFFVEDQPNYRIFIPYDKYARSAKYFKYFENNYGPGKLTLHGPHHDSWYYHPLNAINVWVAITDVKPGKGLSIWPSVWGKRLPFDQKYQIRRDQYFGRPLNFDLGPGDAIVFSAEHLHASELNRLQSTRFVLSFRMTLEKPVYYGAEVYNYINTNEVTDIYDNIISKEDIDKKLLADKIRRLKFVKKRKFDFKIRNNKVPPTDDLSSGFPSQINAEFHDGGHFASFDADLIKEGEIRPLTRSVCVTRSNGNIIAFSRICPHQHADLAAGYIQDEQVFCPWHNLAFNIHTGNNPCNSLANLNIYPVILNDTMAVVNLSKTELNKQLSLDA